MTMLPNYPVTATFKKTFSAGHFFKGLTINDSVPFPTFESAQSWAERVTAKVAAKKFDGYTIHDIKIDGEDYE